MITEQMFACEIFEKTVWDTLSWILVLKANLVVKCSPLFESVITSDQLKILQAVSSPTSSEFHNAAA